MLKYVGNIFMLQPVIDRWNGLVSVADLRWIDLS